MLARIRVQVLRPWIVRPRVAAAVVALLAALSTSSAFAQRGGGGGGGCSGSGGGGGGAGSSGTGSSSGAAGVGLTGLGGMGVASGMQSLAAQQMSLQNRQAFFNISSEAMFASDPPPVFNHQQYLAERRAFRAAQAEQRQQRLALKKGQKPRPERPSGDRG